MVLRIKCVFTVLMSTESAVLVHSGYSFVTVEVKVLKYNKTLKVRSLGKPVSREIGSRILLALLCTNPIVFCCLFVAILHELLLPVSRFK